MLSSLLPDGICELLPPLSSISSTVTWHFLRKLLSGFPKYDDVEGGSTDARTLGSGVVFRLRGGADGLEPGFALPLLLTLGAMVSVLVLWNAGVCGEARPLGARGVGRLSDGGVVWM